MFRLKIRDLFRGDTRTVKAKKNIFASFFLKGLDSLIYILLVPVTLGYLNPYEYGIWLTLNSILMWINSFDIGLGNGMRNKLAIAVANNDKTLGRIYVSTTFIMLAILMSGLIIIGSIIEPYIDWYGILNTSHSQIKHLDEIVYVAFVIFCINFIFKFIGNVYLALQLPAVNNLINTSAHLLSLIIIFILTRWTTGNLMYVAIVYTTTPLVIYLIAYPTTFYKLYPWLRPSIKCFNKNYLMALFDIGVRFFILQLSSILLFSFANLLISHMFGPESVTPYNISYRYFSLVPMIMNLILAPMWSATTDAYTKGDMEWIKMTIKNIHKILIIVTFGLIFMVLISKFVYRIWIGSEVEVPYTMSIIMALYVWILIVSLVYSNFLNGLGKLKIQTINTIIVAFLFLPICYVMGKIMSINGILITMCGLNLSGLILNKIQLNKIISNKATGIWNK